MEHSRRGLARNSIRLSEQSVNIWVNVQIFTNLVCQKAINGINKQISEFLTRVISHAKMGIGVVLLKKDLPWLFNFPRS